MTEIIEPKSEARTRRRSRYDRPRSMVSWVGIIMGLLLGIGGGLYYAWNLDPIEEVNTVPHQLRQADKDQYLVAIMLNYNLDGDLQKAVSELIALELPGTDPIQEVANTACRLARTGYVDSSSGLRAIRSMMAFYQNQGKTGCADELISIQNTQLTPIVTAVLPTATLRPPASKTPTPPGTRAPSPTAPPAFVPTEPPPRDFSLLRIDTYCDVELTGVIEVFVVDFNGQGIPGQPARARWDAGESLFFTGLKPERGSGYADFTMEPGRAYVVDMPALSDPTSPLAATPCTTDSGQAATTSYRVTFRGG